MRITQILIFCNERSWVWVFGVPPTLFPTFVMWQVHTYTKKVTILWSLFRFASVNKKWLLKALFGTESKNPGPSQGRGRWLLLLGIQRCQGAVILEIPPRAWIIKSYQLFPALYRYPQKEIILSDLKRELDGHTFPSHVHWYWDPRVGIGKHPVDWEAFETAFKLFYSSLLLTACLGMPGQSLLYNSCSFGAGLQLQPVWLWVTGLSGHHLGALHCSLKVPR